MFQLSHNSSGLLGCSKEKQRETEVELLTAKAKIARLENQLKSNDTERKRARIEEETHSLGKKEKYSKKDEESHDLQKQVKYLLEKEESSREEVATLKKKLDSISEKYTRDVDRLLTEKEKNVSKQEEV